MDSPVVNITDVVCSRKVPFVAQLNVKVRHITNLQMVAGPELVYGV